MASSIPPITLSAATVDRLPPNVRVPAYDRRALKQGIVHVGVGGFHRAHQAVYLDDLLHRPGSEAYGICGVGLLPQDVRIRDALRAQDYLYTVVTRAAAGDSARVVGSIVDFLYAPDDPEAVVERMASPETRIVSLTVTESGYCEKRATGELDFEHPVVAHDLRSPGRPGGTYGFLAEALRRRRLRGLPPFSVLSCDNLLDNGKVARRMLLAFLGRLDEKLAEWVEGSGAFPGTMVDRITPATTDPDRELVREAFGVDDAWPVVTEPFKQWVIEDHFAAGRPAWEDVGAQLVADVEPYERMKVRLLNGGHQAMCYIGLLLGYRHAPEAMGDGQVRSLVRLFMDREVTPLLPPVPGIDLEDYKKTLRSRFASPATNDQLGRISTDGSTRIAGFVLPTIAEQLVRGGPIHIGAFTVAAWIRHLSGRDDHGGELPFADPVADVLRERAAAGGADASAVLSIPELFGKNLSTSQRFVDEVNVSLRTFAERGARAALERCLGAAG
ncbi:MAG: Mannitol dehydrogenase domain protein [Phycisphaerales bacterium]|nr:Mannitol dehydrogenase domain protein [Phycisphaerales bacterium]